MRRRTLAGDERGAPGGAGLLAVVVGEDRAFVGDAVDVGRAIAHHAAVVGADVPVADVVAHDDEDVRLLLLRERRLRFCKSEGKRRQKHEPLSPAHRRLPRSKCWLQVSGRPVGRPLLQIVV